MKKTPVIYLFETTTTKTNINYPIMSHNFKHEHIMRQDQHNPPPPPTQFWPYTKILAVHEMDLSLIE